MLLPVCLALAPLAPPQDVAPGFDAPVGPYPSKATIRELSDGSYVTANGLTIDRWAADGTPLGTIGSFASAGSTGAMVVDPSETFVVVGQPQSGEILKVDLSGGGQTLLATLTDNVDAAFQFANTVYVSSRTCGLGCGSWITRVNTDNGNVVPIAHVDEFPGPLAFLDDGSLAYATISPPQVQPGASEVLTFTSQQLSSPPEPAFQAYDDLVVIEAESAPPAGDWNEYTTLEGFTGESYYRWDGPDLFGSPGSGILRYEFEVQKADNYKFRIHNRHENPQPDQDNDCWVRVDGGPWLKVFSNEGSSTVGTWNWHSIVEESSGAKYDANYDLTPGKHVLEISGRSNGYRIDRFVFYPLTVFGAKDLDNPESLLAPYNQTYATTYATGLSGPSEMVHDPETDALFVAENIDWNGLNRIQRVDANGGLLELYDGVPFESVRNLEFLAEAGSGAFLPFQPDGNGRLGFSRFDPGSVNERRLLQPLRAETAVSGPGTVTGTGQVTFTITGGPPNGVAAALFAPATTLFPAEYVVPFYGLPLVHSALDPDATQVLPTPVLLDANGGAALTFLHGVGVPDVVAIQGALAFPDGTVAGSTSTVIL